jgi:hypothetical protein
VAEKVSFFSYFSFKEECSEGCGTQNIERYVPVQYLRTYDIQQHFKIEDTVKNMLYYYYYYHRVSEKLLTI